MCTVEIKINIEIKQGNNHRNYTGMKKKRDN